MPGVYEVALGVPLGAILDWPAAPAVPVQAVLVAGLGGGWLPLPAAIAVPWTADGRRRAGWSEGSPR